MNRNELKIKGSPVKQDATHKKVWIPGGPGIKKAVVPGMAEASDKNGFEKENRKQAEERHGA